jgi:hypothetical protein
MPIFVDTDNSNPKDKLYNASIAGQSATKAESKMQGVVKTALEKAPGFTTTKGPGAKGYTIRLKIAKVETEGHQTKCTLSGSIVQYPKGVTKSGAKGDEMLSVGWGGSATASGTSEGSLLDCVEAVAESMMKKGVPVMSADFLKR